MERITMLICFCLIGFCFSDHPAVRRMQRFHPGPVHPESSGAAVAHRVPQVLRLRHPPGGQVFRQRRQHLLQGRLLQVSGTGRQVALMVTET